MIKKFFGFTLGEILITLGVIGVVATLTIPQVIKGKKASEAHAQFTTAYAAISKAIDEMESDNLPVDPTNYSTAGTFYPIFKKYFKLIIDKGGSTSGKPYKFLDNSNMSDMTYMDDGHFVINNGMDIFIENPNNSNPNGLLVWVDINGNDRLPNTMGYDLFGFELMRGGQFMPIGSTGTKKAEWAANPQSYCNIESNTAAGRGKGYTCSLYAVSNPDYFKTLFKGH